MVHGYTNTRSCLFGKFKFLVCKLLLTLVLYSLLCKTPDRVEDADLMRDPKLPPEELHWDAVSQNNLRLDKDVWPYFDSLVRKIFLQVSSTSKRRDKQGKFIALGRVYGASDEAFVR